MKIPISPTSQTPLQDPELGIAPSMERLLKAKGRKSFETRTGFTVVNEGVARAAITSGHCDVFQDLGAFQIRVHVDSNQNKPRSLLVQFTPGTGTVLAVLPGFIGTIVVEDRRVVSVNYTPSHYTDRYQQEYQHVEDEIEKRRALVAVLARNGSFEIERERVHELADYLRMFKSLDPTLGLYATYAYAQAGAYKNVASVHGYMLDEQKSTGIPIPFDVSLLAHKLSEDYWSSVVRVAPFCPMLSQGWALLEPFRGKLSDPVRAAGRFMVPSLWTTFQDKGVDILWSAIEKGAIKSN